MRRVGIERRRGGRRGATGVGRLARTQLALELGDPSLEALDNLPLDDVRGPRGCVVRGACEGRRERSEGFAERVGSRRLCRRVLLLLLLMGHRRWWQRRRVALRRRRELGRVRRRRRRRVSDPRVERRKRRCVDDRPGPRTVDRSWTTTGTTPSFPLLRLALACSLQTHSLPLLPRRTGSGSRSVGHRGILPRLRGGFARSGDARALVLALGQREGRVAPGRLEARRAERARGVAFDLLSHRERDGYGG